MDCKQQVGNYINIFQSIRLRRGVAHSQFNTIIRIDWFGDTLMGIQIEEVNSWPAQQS